MIFLLTKRTKLGFSCVYSAEKLYLCAVICMHVNVYELLAVYNDADYQLIAERLVHNGHYVKSKGTVKPFPFLPPKNRVKRGSLTTPKAV